MFIPIRTLAAVVLVLGFIGFVSGSFADAQSATGIIAAVAGQDQCGNVILWPFAMNGPTPVPFRLDPASVAIGDTVIAVGGVWIYCPDECCPEACNCLSGVVVPNQAFDFGCGTFRSQSGCVGFDSDLYGMLEVQPAGGDGSRSQVIGHFRSGDSPCTVGPLVVAEQTTDCPIPIPVRLRSWGEVRLLYR